MEKTRTRRSVEWLAKQLEVAKSEATIQTVLEGMAVSISPVKVNVNDGAPSAYEICFLDIDKVVELPYDSRMQAIVMDALSLLAKQASGSPQEFRKLTADFIEKLGDIASN